MGSERPTSQRPDILFAPRRTQPFHVLVRSRFMQSVIIVSKS